MAGGLVAGHEEVRVPAEGAALRPGVPDDLSQVVGVLQSIVIVVLIIHVEVGHQLLEAVPGQA